MQKPTSEEKKARRESLRAANTAAARKFPGARLDVVRDSSAVVVELGRGEGCLLTVAKRGEWPRGKYASWDETAILLDDPVALAKFIRALICRYNSMVDQMNETSDIQMAVARKVARPPEESFGGSQDAHK